MSKRKRGPRQYIISTIIALIIIGLTANYFGVLKSKKKAPKQKIENKLTNVIYETVELENAAVSIESNGVLVAKNKIDIVSRAQGIFEHSDHAFRSGVAFAKGDVLVSIDNNEFKANIKASKAQLLQSLTAILADLKFEYPDSFEQWNQYVNNFDVNRSLSELPIPNSDREKAFINGKNIYTQFYNIKAQEVKNNYYQIRAPFSGILSNSNINKGALVNVGQQLGTFIDPSVYEMEVKINPSELDLISIGKKVSLTNNDKSKNWSGKVVRINKIIDPQSQSALAIVEVRGRDLREGMYLQAGISTIELSEVAKIPRNLLIDEKFVYLISDSLLLKKEIDPVHISDKNVFVKGLTNGDWMIHKSVAGAYDGMKVNPIKLSE